MFCCSASQIRSPYQVSSVHCGPLSTMTISKYLSWPGLVSRMSGGEPKKKGLTGYRVSPTLISDPVFLLPGSLSPHPHSWGSNSLANSKSISWSFGPCLAPTCAPWAEGVPHLTRAALWDADWRICGSVLHCVLVRVPTLAIWVSECLQLQGPSGPPWFLSPRVVLLG